MKTNKILMAVMAVFVISIMSLSVMAFRGDPDEQGPNYNAEVHAKLEAALESGEYETWLDIRTENNLPTKGKIFSVIDESNFDMFVDLHNANKGGNSDLANQIRSDLGLGQGMMKRGSGSRMGQGMQGQGMKGQFQGSNNGGNFVDADNDGNCDNSGLNLGRGKR